jgi:hypothetical protein
VRFSKSDLQFFIETIRILIRYFNNSTLTGIGAIIRIPKADRESAISSSKLLIFEIEYLSGTISYNVTDGPTVALI